jgi:hypothetical protein
MLSIWFKWKAPDQLNLILTTVKLSYNDHGYGAAVPNLFLLAYPQAEKQKLTYPLVNYEGILWHFHKKY